MSTFVIPNISLGELTLPFTASATLGPMYIIVDTTGTYTMQLAEDTTTHLHYFVAGAQYHMQVEYIPSAGQSGNIYGYYAQNPSGG